MQTQKTTPSTGYWILQLTWGGLTTWIGLIVALVLAFFPKSKRTFHINGFGLIIEIGGNWGGLSLGPIALCGNYSKDSKAWYEHTRRHEFGHSIQNMFMGPFFIFLVALPSVIRYWYFQWCDAHNKQTAEYDSIWFEGTATSWGTTIMEAIENGELK